jgi:NitT/TauT family transport system substrate-binding protein
LVVHLITVLGERGNALNRHSKALHRRVPKLSAAVLCLALPVLLLAGCRGGRAAEDPGPLRFAVLPVLDTLPIYVAEAEGYFEAEGISVVLVPASSAGERDQLLQARQVDGAITDLVALALYNREVIRVIAVRCAMAPTPEFAQFRLLAAPGSGIEEPGDLRGVPIGVSEATIIEYVTKGLLAAEGLAEDEIVMLGVPKIPERMALLAAGELRAATLPEPLASLAMQQGATLILDDRAFPELSGSFFAFKASVIRNREADVDRFLRAIDRASADINADKSKWDHLLTEQALIPASLSGSYTLPDYPTGGLPTEPQFSGVISWLQATVRLGKGPAHKDVVR